VSKHLDEIRKTKLATYENVLTLLLLNKPAVGHRESDNLIIFGPSKLNRSSNSCLSS